MHHVPYLIQIRGRLSVIFMIGLMSLGFLSACAPVFRAPDVLSIEHPANQFIIAEVRAQNYCSERNADARHIQSSPIQAGFLFLRTRLSTFECVPRKPVTAGGPEVTPPAPGVGAEEDATEQDPPESGPTRTYRPTAG